MMPLLVNINSRGAGKCRLSMWPRLSPRISNTVMIIIGGFDFPGLVVCEERYL